MAVAGGGGWVPSAAVLYRDGRLHACGYTQLKPRNFVFSNIEKRLSVVTDQETKEKEEVWLAGRLWDAIVPLQEGKIVQIDMRAGQFGELERRLRLSEDFQEQAIDYTVTRR
jgi:hypothetical protein